jgi:hypothetical protein
LRQQRVGLQQKIKVLVAECNAVILKENMAAEARDKAVSQKQRNEQERDRLSVSSTQCLAVIESYNKFMTVNEQFIEEIKHNFEGLWTKFESVWKSWTADDITTWFRYKTVEMDTHDVDWRKVKEELERRKITGKSFRKFSELTFEPLGIVDFEMVHHLMSCIRGLREGDTSPSSSRSDQEIPSDYICPITKQLMKEPVMAFDGHCYERKAIEDYLQSHQKSPVTGKKADFAIVFPNHRLRGEIEVFMKGSGGGEGNRIFQFLNENNTAEGVPQTQ